jgi:hypothetical protein
VAHTTRFSLCGAVFRRGLGDAGKHDPLDCPTQAKTGLEWATCQEKAARKDSLQATRNAVQHRAMGVDLTKGARTGFKNRKCYYLGSGVSIFFSNLEESKCPKTIFETSSKHYNQSPKYHEQPQGSGALCPNGCHNRTSSGPYTNSNPTKPVQHWINIYD